MQIVEELHAARVGKSVDSPVVLLPGELTSMEVDVVEDDRHCSAGTPCVNVVMSMVSALVRMSVPIQFL